MFRINRLSGDQVDNIRAIVAAPAETLDGAVKLFCPKFSKKMWWFMVKDITAKK